MLGQLAFVLGQELSRTHSWPPCHPTLWNATFEAMIRDGFRGFLEVGPGKMICRMSRWIDRSVACREAGSLETIDEASRILREGQ